jgi:8-oxo-dGTP diphosphatase
MTREFSAGGIVFNKKGQVLVIKNASMRDKRKIYFGFPKGRLDEKESNKNAALREVKEETGIDAEIIEKVGESKYVFTFNGEKIFKVVTIFLMKVLTEEINYQKEELEGAEWMEIDEALKILSFSNDKKLLQETLKILDKPE